MLTRRRFTAAGGSLLAGLGAARATSGVVEIDMWSDEQGEQVGFDPIGIMLQPGQTVRWRCRANYHTTTAYHPANERRSLRIPRRAVPWASEVLAPGEVFEVTLDVEGVYDYCCAPHEEAGMVGRIIIGRATGPGSMPFDWFRARDEGRAWLAVPAAARVGFPAISKILQRKIIPGWHTDGRTTV